MFTRFPEKLSGPNRGLSRNSLPPGRLNTVILIRLIRPGGRDHSHGCLLGTIHLSRIKPRRKLSLGRVEVHATFSKREPVESTRRVWQPNAS